MNGWLLYSMTFKDPGERFPSVQLTVRVLCRCEWPTARPRQVLFSPMAISTPPPFTPPLPAKYVAQMKGKIHTLVAMCKKLQANKEEAETAASASAAASSEAVARLETELSHAQACAAEARAATSEAVSQAEGDRAAAMEKTAAAHAAEVAEIRAQLEDAVSDAAGAAALATEAEAVADGKVNDLKERIGTLEREGAEAQQHMRAAAQEAALLRREGEDGEQELCRRVEALEVELKDAEERVLSAERATAEATGAASIAAETAAQELAAAGEAVKAATARLSVKKEQEDGAVAAARAEEQEKASAMKETLETAVSERAQVRFV